MFALFQLTFFDHSGAVDSEVTADHLGSPERLRANSCQDRIRLHRCPKRAHLIETTSQFLATAALQILLPKKPFPPQTTIFRLADADAAVEAIVEYLCVVRRYWEAVGRLVAGVILLP